MTSTERKHTPRQLTWLHISDFHFTGVDYNQDIVMRSLVESVHRYRIKEKRNPDLIFAAGDIAFSGKESEYDVATGFFDSLLSVASLDRSRLFIIPGNHDVNRAAGKFLKRTLANEEDSDDFFAYNTRQPHYDKLNAYCNWYNNYFQGIRQQTNQGTCQVEFPVIQGIRLGLLTINSALFCIDDTDEHNLWVGRSCLNRALETMKAANPEFCVALVHHPFEWLHGEERSRVKQLVRDNVDCVLRGHLHEAEVESVADYSSGALYLAAGACYQRGNYPKSAFFTRIDVDAGKAWVFPIGYQSTAQTWTVDPSVFPEAAPYEGEFLINGSSIPKSPEPETLGENQPPADQSGLNSDHSPAEYAFDYEKTIIDEYIVGNGRLSDKRIEDGCPAEWPHVPKKVADKPNPIRQEQIGSYRKENATIIVDARADFHNAEIANIRNRDKQFLTFPEAGPREKLYYPKARGNKQLKVGILVSGGIAPGINAVIDGIVGRHNLYAKRDGHKIQTYGYLEGFKALLRGSGNNIFLTPEAVEGKAHLGGSMIGTSRAHELVSDYSGDREMAEKEIVGNLRRDGIEILYVIGGDGSMRAAHNISLRAKRDDYDLSVVGVPKTMDNDILWVWQAFGFLSAVDRAKEAILQLHTEATSNPRLCIVQLFGSDSGFVATHAALASGICDYVLIPEVGFTIKIVSEHMREKLRSRYRQNAEQQRPYGMIVMAETAIPYDAGDYIEDPYIRLYETEKKAIRDFIRNNRRVHGQTPDELRTGGLKILSRVLERDIRKMSEDVDGDDYWEDFRVFTNEPRHLIRAIGPSVADVLFAQRLGALAVDNAMAGYTDFMVSQWLTEYVLVPLHLVILGRKRVPRNGIFWKSVLANTGQVDEGL